MVSRWVQVREIARMAFEEAIRRKIFYVVFALLVWIGVSLARQQVEFTMAGAAGESKLVAQGEAEYVKQVFNLWGTAALFLGVYLGAVALSSEISGRTLLNTLSRPVDRTTYLVSRWLGTLAFLWSFQAVGMGIGLGLAFYFDVPHTPMLWLGVVSTFVTLFLVSGVTVAASVVATPVGAGLLAALVIIAPGMARATFHHPRWAVRTISTLVYMLAPAQMPVDLVETSFSRQVMNPPYVLYASVLGENALYAIAVFGVACAVFRRRDMLVR